MIEAIVMWTVLVVGLPVSAFLIWWLRVLSPQVLMAAPARRSTLSLPVIGGAIIIYLFVETALATLGYAGGWLTKADLGIQESPASQPATTSQPAATATQAATATSPAQPATTTSSETDTAAAPATAPSDPGINPDVKMNIIGTLTYALTAIPILLFVPLFFKERFSGWGLSWRQIPAGIWKGLLAFAVVYPIVTLVGLGLGILYDQFQHKVTEHSTFEALDTGLSQWQQIFLYFTAIVVAPLMEELFFRGIVQTTLVQFRWGLLIPQFMQPGALPQIYQPPAGQRWAAIVITSLAFAFLHPLDHVPLIFALSLGLGYVYERTGILWASMVLHAAFNGTEMALYTFGGSS